MSKQLIKSKLNELDFIIVPDSFRIRIPVAIALQEALNLYAWCQNDKEDLIRSGLNWEFVEDIPGRADTLRKSQSLWYSEDAFLSHYQSEWRTEFCIALNICNELVHHYRYAISKNSKDYSKIKIINKGHSNDDIIQKLIALAKFGMKHKKELSAIGFDLRRLDEAKTKSFELSKLLAKVNRLTNECNPKQNLRNKAYIHLKEAVTEINRVGQYVFWRDKKRLQGYRSSYLHRNNERLYNKREK